MSVPGRGVGGDPDDALGRDTRAVSEVIGFMLVVAILLLALALVQALAVPAWNADTERAHAERVQADMLGLDSDVVSAAGFGGDRVARVDLGVRYPTRPFLLNPPPGAGELSTDERQVELENLAVRTSDNADAYWAARQADGPATLESRAVEYEPPYLEYPGATTRLEAGAVFNEFDDRTVVRADTRLVDGSGLSLVTLDGDLSTASTTATSVPVRTQSAPARTVVVGARDETEPLVIRAETTASEEAWRRQLADEPHVVEWSLADGVLTVELDPERNYRLRMANVRLGGPAEPPEPAYLTAVGSTTVAEGEPLTVAVRDRFNNPVPDAEVTPETITGACDLDPKRTDEDGRVTFTCSESGTVDLTIGDADYERETFTVGADTPSDDELPEVTDGSVAVEERTFRIQAGPNRDMRQFTAGFAAADAGSGLDHAYLRVYDTAQQRTVTATTHRFEGNASASSRWITPWLELPGADDRYEVRLRVVDRAGNAVEYCASPNEAFEAC